MLASAREWEAVPLDRVGGRAGADALLRVAQRARIDLKIGGPEDEAVLVNGVNRLRTRHVVGMIVAGQTRLEILPKIDDLDDGAARARLVGMIAGALDVRIAEGELTELGSRETDLLEVIVRLFCARVTALARRGLPRGYVDRVDDLPFLRGRLDLGRQLTRTAIAPTLLACAYDELSPDIPLNRVIKAAVVMVARMTRSAANRRRLHELEALFEEVATIAPDRLSTAMIILDRTQRRWAEALALARLLLERNFQTVSAGTDRGFALLFDMNTLFETFIGRNLRRALEDTDLTVTLQGPKRHAVTEGGRGASAPSPTSWCIALVAPCWSSTRNGNACARRPSIAGAAFRKPTSIR